jgi:O-antigen/teichoic acid export membrane protein
MKKFLKSFSIYGLIPIVGKFLSVLLLPLYTRLLTPEEYGVQDILVQFAIFLTFLINIELYNGVGRHIYDRDDIKGKQRLVSTGLWLTVFMGIIVIALISVFHDAVYNMFFADTSNMAAFYLAIIWAPISAIYTYLLVLMKFEQKPKLYFTLVNIQLLIRISSSVLFVAGLRMGVKGVILGHIVGETSAVIMFSFVLCRYIRPVIHIPDLRDILKFSLPLVPAVLIVSFQKPLVRYLVANYLTIEDMGFYTVASQVASVLVFVQYGLKMSWQPHLYELILKDGYEKEVKRIYNLFQGILSLVTIALMLNGRLILKVLTTPSYYSAASLIGFIAINSMLEITRMISGCGPIVAKKTMYNVYYEITASVAVVVGFVLLHRSIGIIGLAVAFLAGTLVKFIWSWELTKRFTKIRFSMLPTYSMILFLLCLATLMALVKLPFWVGILGSLVAFALFLHRYKSNLLKLFETIKERVPIGDRG